MAKISKLKIDLTSSEEGNWLTIHDDLRFRVARWGNPRFRNAIDSLTSNRKQEISRGTLSKEDDDRIIAIAMARGIITDWENFEDDDGTKIEFNIQNAEKLLRDPEMCWVLDFVKDYSQDQENFRLASLEEDSGN